MDRNNNFTMIHIMGALMVLVGHMFIMLGEPAPAIFADGWLMHEVGVGILFTVSGYLTTRSYIHNRDKKARAARFLVKRFLRVYPPLIACLVLTVLVMRFVTVQPEAYWASAKQYFLSNLKLKTVYHIDGVFGDNIYPGAINGSLWTLPVEVACYFMLFPVLEVVLRIPRKAGLAVGGALMLGSTLFFIFQGGLGSIRAALDSRIPGWIDCARVIMWFFIGVFCGLCDVRKYLKWQLALALVIPYVCLCGTLRRFCEPYIYSYIVMCFGEAEKPMFARLFRRDICYGLYLYAFPTAQLIVHFLVVRRQLALPTVVYIALNLGVTWLLALMNHYLVERSVSRIKFLKRIT